MLKMLAKRVSLAFKPSALAGAMLSASLGCALGSTSGFDQGETQELKVSVSFAGKQSMAPGEKIELRLSRPLNESDGKPSVFIGQTDLTGLFAINETSLSYTPTLLPLREGTTEVIVYLVSPANRWSEIARLPLLIADDATGASNEKSAPAGGIAQDTSGSTQSPANRKTPGSEKFAIAPSLTLGFKSQAAESHFPDSSRPPRPTFADFTVQGTVKTDFARGVVNAQTQFDIAGSSFQGEALRFSKEGDRAPQIDLSSYLMQFQISRAQVQTGHISISRNRLLVNGFSSRGVGFTMPLQARGEIAFAAMNGTSIVGWNNFFGLSKRDHQLFTGNLGLEFIKERPGGLRLETTFLEGRLLPVSNFNQGSITDADRNQAAGLRLLASDKAQRLRLEAGFARSRFGNAADPLLNQGVNVVPVREVTRNARYLDFGYALLKDLEVTNNKKLNLRLDYRHERVDPLYRTIAAPTQADRFQNQIDLNGSLGDITASVSYLRLNDNLANIPSILKSLTRNTAIALGVPVASLFGGPVKPAPWLPRLSYNFTSSHQFAASMPVNGGFEVDPSTVPDQRSTNQNLAAEWQFNKVRFGYRFNRSFQDNRQVGRQLADFRNLINGLTISLNPHRAVDLNFELSSESANNRQIARTDQTLRMACNLNWRTTESSALTMNFSNTGVGSTGGVTSSRSSEFDVQWSRRFAFEKDRFRKLQSQFFIRYSDRFGRSRDSILLVDNLNRLQTLNTGVTLTFF